MPTQHPRSPERPAPPTDDEAARPDEDAQQPDDVPEQPDPEAPGNFVDTKQGEVPEPNEPA